MVHGTLGWRWAMVQGRTIVICSVFHFTGFLPLISSNIVFTLNYIKYGSTCLPICNNLFGANFLHLQHPNPIDRAEKLRRYRLAWSKQQWKDPHEDFIRLSAELTMQWSRGQVESRVWESKNNRIKTETVEDYSRRRQQKKLFDGMIRTARRIWLRRAEIKWHEKVGEAHVQEWLEKVSRQILTADRPNMSNIVKIQGWKMN